jgi:hypothetical protein
MDEPAVQNEKVNARCCSYKWGSHIDGDPDSGNKQGAVSRDLFKTPS